MKTAKEFFEDLKNNKEWAQEIQNELEKFKEWKDGKTANACIIDFAQTKGYQISAEDLHLNKAKSRVATEEELKATSGAGLLGDGFCDYAWDCDYVFGTTCKDCYSN